jgi:hypothetical protein
MGIYPNVRERHAPADLLAGDSSVSCDVLVIVRGAIATLGLGTLTLRRRTG